MTDMVTRRSAAVRSGRDLVVLGTACATPTGARNQNGYLLRWGEDDLLFDPGEGTQRQLSRVGASLGRLSHIFISHLHGDHCLGLPGVLERIGDARAAAMPVHFPASGLPYIERLTSASIGAVTPTNLDAVDRSAAASPQGIEVASGPQLRVTARLLDHVVDSLGWRVEVPPAPHLDVDRLAAAGIDGPDIGRLVHDGAIDVAGRHVERGQMTDVHAGQSVAVLMDTRPCDAALALADGVDLLLCEATYLEADAALADERRHLTARGAATIAREAGVGLLVLTHFSARYDSTDAHRAEAAAVFDDVIVAGDLEVVRVPAHLPRARSSEVRS
jgi:ribonuclease Z